jgi:hypothetical protein
MPEARNGPEVANARTEIEMEMEMEMPESQRWR